MPPTESCSGLSRPPVLLLLQDHQDHHRPVGTRQSHQVPTLVFVWICPGMMRAMRINSGCGNATDKNRSAGSLTIGRSGLELMSRNALTQVTCLMACNCLFGIAMARTSKHGAMTLMPLACTWPVPALAWITTPTSSGTGSLCMCGNAMANRTRSGRSGTLTLHPHRRPQDLPRLGPHLSVTAVGLHRAAEVTMARCAIKCAADLTARNSWCEHWDEPILFDRMSLT